MHTEIPLTQDKVAIVCDCHADLVNTNKWYALKASDSNVYYAVRKSSKLLGKQKNIFMHRIISNPPDGYEVDHINHNTLDNRCVNLRNVTHKQNLMNVKKRSDNTSGFKGVSLVKPEMKWRAVIKCNGKCEYIGTYNTPEEAGAAYDKAAKIHYGEFALLNFP